VEVPVLDSNLRVTSIIFALGALIGLAACSDAADPDRTEASDTSDTTDTGPIDTAGPTDTGDAPGATYVITVPELTVKSGVETYMCYTMTLDRPLTATRFSFAGRPWVHHFLVSKSLAPARDGLEPCDVLFRTTWMPLISSGAGRAEIAAPSGAGWRLEKGDQIVVQLHLLNANIVEVGGQVPFEVHTTERTDLAPIGLYAFGTTEVALPARTRTSIHNDCLVEQRVEAFAIFPHMHMLGRRMTLEAGPDADSLVPVFTVDPWDFNRQSIDLEPLVLEPGTFTRITCEYDNPGNDAVTFGESSFNEMCFLVTFVTEGSAGLDGCLTLSGPLGEGEDPPKTGACGSDAPNALGIGQACTKDGGECQAGTQCSADLSDEGGSGYCLRLGCDTTADCGGGAAVCCTPELAGGLLNICITNNCRPDPCPVSN
jgi:hypothetical protein